MKELHIFTNINHCCIYDDKKIIENLNKIYHILIKRYNYTMLIDFHVYQKRRIFTFVHKKIKVIILENII